MLTKPRPFRERCEPTRGGLPIEPDARYRFSLWDHEEQDWMRWKEGLRLMEVRAAVREAESRGYSSMSYFVEREGEDDAD